ncbi:hypothetical protein K9N72_24855 [Klebsiella pneumoniae]|uniref:hypothetical protein n=1 Tax=Klebsiella pneumoniae TaxID=573 RepID=UPI001CC0AB22|nr:hypothetical protein [Klebsiella pneumoniae]MBZ3792877.1 hypothetical protein [Klebsiella pneumoniae]
MIQSSSSDAVSLTPKQANIYVWGWQRSARFRDAVCGRRFGKTFLGKACFLAKAETIHTSTLAGIEAERDRIIHHS